MSDMVNSIIQFLSLFVNIVFLAHWMACIFYLVGREASTTDPQSWIIMTNVIDMDVYDKYVTSLYWAITTMITVYPMSPILRSDTATSTPTLQTKRSASWPAC
ncbi:MAG: ion transporter [Candidatus Pacebacteria bacterium]|nr:ion transporter [Candidatus Paceibacterota bacterium]